MGRVFIPSTNLEGIFKGSYEKLHAQIKCTYLFYQLEIYSCKVTYSTHSEWMDMYINKSLMQKCPILRGGVSKMNRSKDNSVLLRWNDVIPSNSDEKKTNGLRAEFNICNGMSYGKKWKNATEYLGIATKKDNIHFTREIILNPSLVRTELQLLRNAACFEIIKCMVTNNIKQLATFNFS